MEPAHTYMSLNATPHRREAKEDGKEDGKSESKAHRYLLPPTIRQRTNKHSRDKDCQHSLLRYNNITVSPSQSQHGHCSQYGHRQYPARSFDSPPPSGTP